jgi:hypothetical protein
LHNPYRPKTLHVVGVRTTRLENGAAATEWKLAAVRTGRGIGARAGPVSRGSGPGGVRPRGSGRPARPARELSQSLAARHRIRMPWHGNGMACAVRQSKAAHRSSIEVGWAGPCRTTPVRSTAGRPYGDRSIPPSQRAPPLINPITFLSTLMIRRIT